MKKRLSKIITLTMSSVMAIGTLFGCAESTTVSDVCPEGYYFPEYTIEDSGKTYESFAYGNIFRGDTYTVDGQVLDCDLATGSKEAFQLYKDAGFTLAYLIYTNMDETLKAMDVCQEVGLKCIITDFWFLDAVTKTGDLVDASNPNPSVGRKYQTYELLKEAVKEHLDVFVSHPAFYGLNMRDEPTIDYLEDFCELYHAIRDVETQCVKADGTNYKEGEIYLHCNLLPLGINDGKQYWDDPSTPGVDYETLGEAYEKYVRAYLEGTGAKQYSVDIYEFRRDGVFPGFFSTMQMFRQACKDYGAEMTYVQQSFNTFTGSTESYARVTGAEMLSETYTAMAMGVTHYSYYTYLPYQDQSISGTHSLNHFLDLNGNPTNVYYFGQAAMKEAKFLADIVYNYEWQGSNFVVNPNPDELKFGTAPYLTSRADTNTGTNAPFDTSFEFELIKNVKLDNDIVFVSELKDEKNNLYMYAIQNVLNPRDAAIDVVDVNVEVDFGEGYDYVAEIANGVINYVKLDKGVYKKALSAGYASFVVPLAKTK